MLIVLNCTGRSPATGGGIGSGYPDDRESKPARIMVVRELLFERPSRCSTSLGIECSLVR